MAPTIVTRAQWGARAPKGTISTTTWSQRVGVAIHHSAGPVDQTVRQIQDYQMDSNGWVDIGYNWLVDQAGRLYEGRQGTWLAIGAHSAGENIGWVSVCWIGNSSSVAPSAAALSTLRWVYDEARRRAGRALQVSGHGQLPGEATECPGSRLRAWIAAGLPTDEGDDVTKAEVLEVLAEFFDAPYTAGGLVDDDTVPAGWAKSLKRRIAYAGMTAAPKSRARFAADVWADPTGRAVLAAVAGQDVAAAVAAELAAHDQAMAQRLAGLPAALAALVPAASAEQVEAALRTVLGGVDEPR
jgi:hypothetical protein